MWRQTSGVLCQTTTLGICEKLMAKIKMWGRLGDPLGILREKSLHLVHLSKHDVEFRGDYGTIVDLHGHGFSVTGHASAGTVTSAQVFFGSKEVVDVKNADLDATHIAQELKQVGAVALFSVFAAGDDHLVGSAKSELLDGSIGDDVIQGGAGEDLLLGNAGNDTITGGEGNDDFMFHRGFGVDRITDFEDRGSHQDVIETDRDMYLGMEKRQEGDNVVLDFGSGDEIIIEHAQVKDIGRDDLHFT